MRKFILELFIAVYFFGLSAETHAEEAVRPKPSSLTVYAGQSNSNDLLQIIHFEFGGFEPYPILGLEYSKVFRETRFFDLEWAFHFVKHFETVSLFELDGLATFRWKSFPWNEWVTTSLGIGEGVSWATGYPSSESVSQNIRAPLLNYLWIDVRMGLPSMPEWFLDLILHHRSGVYGLLGVAGGSNYISLGVTRRF